MLGKDDVLSRLASGEIGVAYEFDLISGITPTRFNQPAPVDPGASQSVAYRTFENHFFGDRLALTLGPVVVSDRHLHLNGRVLFKGRPGHFDLRAADNAIEIMPGESLCVNTVEYITLGGQTAAYVLPRLTLATAGLVIATTYIDPRWEGILQLYLTNLSRHSYRLAFGERIAICRFYTVTGSPVPEEVKSRFAQKSHHYGYNWQRVLDTDVETQPRRKRPIPASVYIERVRAGLGAFVKTWQNIVGVALVGSVVAAIYAYAQFKERASSIDALTQQLGQLQAQANTDHAAAELLRRQLPISGTVEVELPKGQASTFTEISLGTEPPRNPDVWLFAVPANPLLSLRGSINRDQGSQTSLLRIDLRDQAGQQNTPRSYMVHWLIVTR